VLVPYHEHDGKPERLDLRSLGTVVPKQPPPAPPRDKRPNAVDQGVLNAAEREAHERRLAHIKANGWALTEEGWILNQDDPRWHKQARILVPYAEGVSFEDGVRSAYGRQKFLEAEALATKQRREGGRR
jgi:hypothetical protein